MNKIHVLNNVAYLAKTGGGVISGINEIDLLAPGALAIINDKGVVVPALETPSTSLNDVKAIQFAVGKPGGGASLSDPIVRIGANYNAKTYVAGLAQVDFLGDDGTGTPSLNLPTLVAGDEAYIRVIDRSTGLLSPGQGGRRKWNASYTVKTGDDAAVILAALVAKINALIDITVTAAVVAADGISFTGNAVGVAFDVGFGGILESADIVKDGAGNSVAGTVGVGTVAQVKDFINYANPEFGQGNRTHLAEFYFSRETNLSLTGTYDLYMIRWNTVNFNGINNQPGALNEYVVAMPNGASTISQANFESLMAVVFATDSAAQPESGSETAA